MIPFHLIFAAVFAITFLSGFAATVIALWGGNRSNQCAAEKLAQIALLGAGALIALLGTSAT